jgi:carbon monoxide dehydrogenase subunit G
VSELARDVVVIPGTVDLLWDVLHDDEALMRVIPGAEHIERVDRERFRGVLASRIQFVTIRADVDATLTGAPSDKQLLLVLDGRPRGLVGTFRVSVPFDVDPQADGNGGTAIRISYAVDIAVTGRLASFGLPILRSTFRGQIDALVANLEAEMARRAA